VNEMNGKVGDQIVLSRSYLASLPERTARAAAALTGGLVYEASEVTLPVAVRRTKLYQAVVGRLLRITIELVGGVEGVYPAEEMPARELLVRKTAGNAVELASFMAVGWSPVWLLAGASDLVGGSKAYLRALVVELRDAGVLAADAEVGRKDPEPCKANYRPAKRSGSRKGTRKARDPGEDGDLGSGAGGGGAQSFPLPWYSCVAPSRCRLGTPPCCRLPQE
jgi:hypothetical protein